MTGRGAAVQGGLAAASLIAVYFTWQREPERAPGSVTVIEAGKSDIARVHYEDENTSVDLQRGHGDSEPPVWIHLVTKTKADDKNKPAAGKPPEPKTPPPRDLGGGEAAEKLYDQFAPLLSPRGFGALDGSKLKELGLDAPTRKLDVTVKGAVRHFDIGVPKDRPGGESFMRDGRDGRVYLMPRAMLADLQNVQHIIERKMHTFDQPEFDRIVISAGGKKKEFVQLSRESHTNAGLAPAKTPDKRDQAAKNWHDALWRVFPAELLGRGEEPPAGKPAVAVRVDYYDGKKQIGFAELARADAAGQTSDEASASNEIYMRTEHTAGWAKVPAGAQLVMDAQKLVSAP